MMRLVIFCLLSLCYAKHVDDRAFAGSVIYTDVNPVLLSKAESITESDLECRPDLMDSNSAFLEGCGAVVEGWVDLMLRGLREANGGAIAAPQVGISKRLIIVALTKERLEEEPEHFNSTVTPPVVLINPIVWPVFESGTQDVWETCLSQPGKQVTVKRYHAIHYQGLRMDGTLVAGVARGRLAIHLQHELDHLDGVLMTHRAKEEKMANETRSDGLQAVLSTTHWDLMADPNYDIRTATFPGAVQL